MKINNICFIEDDNLIAQELIQYFSFENYQVLHFSDYKSFISHDLRTFTGIYLVDWNLPDRPGIEIISEIRKKDKVSPIFIISGYSEKDDIIQGLKAGADDYITKPVRFDELLVRVENALSKFVIVKESMGDELIKFLPEAKSFIKDAQTISLTAREYIIFEYLYKNMERPVSREEITNQFDASDKITDRNIDVHVFSLRKKIAQVSMKVETVWKKGYKVSF